MDDRPNISPTIEDYEARYIVINGTTEIMADVSVCHECAEVAWTNKATAALLNPGATTPVQILRSRSLYPDLWDICLTRGGNLYVKGDGEGNIPVLNSGGLCVVSLGAEYVQILPSYSGRYVFFLKPRIWPPEAQEGLPGSAEQAPDGVKKAAAVNEDYLGSFVVINATNDPITDIHIVHKCNDQPDPFKDNWIGKDKGSSLETMHCATGHGDYWTVSFRDAAGQLKVRTEKRCDYTLGDSPQVCLIILYDNNFSIIPPSSSPCLHNYYD